MIRHASRVALSALTLCSISGLGFAQGSTPIAQQFEKLHFRSIGPATMSGRIADLAVYERNPAIWYVGTAHGGVWKTTSNGVSFTPLLRMRRQSSYLPGDICLTRLNTAATPSITSRLNA